ncbi:Topoisomerase IV subunit A [Labilithrix luteola]|uniref:Topoisomerase IV subunit A n=1 Tax=Labilithrix luteola TaxID=1391654 RepID=A0A0K1PU44_9BACT|nr:DNA topoisomerase IV subunit A [Labilithrix luteola]AKU96886.1 Topoisomerase IV subunit A [Labilithrix luteola]
MSRASTTKTSAKTAAKKAGGTTRGTRVGGPPRKGGNGDGENGHAPPPEDATTLSAEARTRYLNYALSVITSRALPDVRDGLKPVQRRILLTMRRDLGLTPDARYRKSAKIVGDVMGNYHPHGDSAIYDAMVRLAQSWVMRLPLVDGQGNFGSPDGDGAAAYRYTEAKLRPAAIELLSELDKRTVAWRPNYDGSRSEPVVLPARLPHLLINGAQGIAVGMATSIPPHNPSEVIDACIAQIDAGKGVLPTKTLLKYIKGPDFPTGGQIVASRSELTNVYETGSGTLKLRGEWKLEERKGGTQAIILTSLPYGVVRGSLVERIAEIIVGRKLAALTDVRDESTGEVRVVLEMKKGTDPNLVMAYLYKNTSLQTTVGINLTCLVPGAPPITVHGADDGEALPPEENMPAVPERLSLGQMIRHFLDFRMLTVERRLRYDLALLRRRIHILEGFAIVFDALDETIRIIRKSDGKADAAKKLIARFGLSEEQVDAILELKLYRLAKLEILVIREELEQKQKEAKALEVILKSEAKRWALIKGELVEIKQLYGDKRRAKIAGATDEQEYSAEDFIVAEDANVILSTQGWIKRLREVKDLATTRVREGDSVLAATAGSTKSVVAFFSSLGACYVMRMNDVPATTGYGDPVQKFFKMEDGERIIAMMSFDPRVLEVPPPVEGGEPQAPFAVAVTKQGLSFRFSLSAHREPSTRAGRKYGKLNANDEIVMVSVTSGDRDGVLVVTSDGHALGVPVKDLALLSGVGKGSMLIKIDDDVRVLGAIVALAPNDSIVAESPKGKETSITYKSVLGKRAQAGTAIVRRDGFARVVPPAPTVPPLEVN